MSPTFRIVYFTLWCAHPVLELGVATLMFRRKMHKQFPVFFAYVLSQVVIFSLLFPIQAHYFIFFYTYWITAAISLGLGFYVIYELFLDVFKPYHTLKDLGTVLFKWAGLVMLLVAGVVAAASPVSYAQDGPLVQAVFTVQRCVRVIQCGLVLFLLLFSRYLGVSWRQKNFGIALGFGFVAAVELFIVALLAANHVHENAGAIVNMVAYNMAILVWLGYAYVKEKARAPSENLLMSQRWEQSFMDLQHPMPADSLIPMFENMVEAAISRQQDASPYQSPPAEMGAEHAGADDPGADAPLDMVQSLLESVSSTLATRSDEPHHEPNYELNHEPQDLTRSASASGGGTSSKH
jgi:hypothetical protein